jgi:hypothetical protein
MWEPYSDRANDCGDHRGGGRTTPLLARPTPRLRDESRPDSPGGGQFASIIDWSGPLRVPNGQRDADTTISQRLASIEAVPYNLLGWAERCFLLHWVRRGYPVYAYRAPTGHWNLWLDTWRVPLPLPLHLRLAQPDESLADDD